MLCNVTWIFIQIEPFFLHLTSVCASTLFYSRKVRHNIGRYKNFMNIKTLWGGKCYFQPCWASITSLYCRNVCVLRGLKFYEGCSTFICMLGPACPCDWFSIKSRCHWDFPSQLDRRSDHHCVESKNTLHYSTSSINVRFTLEFYHMDVWSNETGNENIIYIKKKLNSELRPWRSIISANRVVLPNGESRMSRKEWDGKINGGEELEDIVARE